MELQCAGCGRGFSNIRDCDRCFTVYDDARAWTVSGRIKDELDLMDAWGPPQNGRVQQFLDPPPTAVAHIIDFSRSGVGPTENEFEHFRTLVTDRVKNDPEALEPDFYMGWADEHAHLAAMQFTRAEAEALHRWLIETASTFLESLDLRAQAGVSDSWSVAKAPFAWSLGERSDYELPFATGANEAWSVRPRAGSIPRPLAP